MSKRKAISKRVRFEVFKRDSFTCQYCGAKAPDVVLHCDHIHPVAEGGTNEILNLVTACADCNGGKGARKLDDSSAVERQRAQLEELSDRREQLEMMLAWRDGLQSEAKDVVSEVCDRVAERTGFSATEAGKADIRRWLRRFSLSELLYALDEAFDNYLRYEGDAPTEESVFLAFSKIPAFASLRKQAAEKPYIQRLAYIQGILRRRLNDPRGQYLDVLEHAIVTYGHTVEELERVAKQSDSWDEFVALMADILRRRTRGGE